MFIVMRIHVTLNYTFGMQLMCLLIYFSTFSANLSSIKRGWPSIQWRQLVRHPEQCQFSIILLSYTSYSENWYWFAEMVGRFDLCFRHASLDLLRIFSSFISFHYSKVEIGVTSDGSTIVCYHPSVDVPYELTQVSYIALKWWCDPRVDHYFDCLF
jgi:hypothetical protein